MADAIAKWGRTLPLNHKLGWAFEELDLDASGHIDSAEFHNLYRCLGFDSDKTMREPKLEDIVVNSKAEMNKDEFIVWWKQTAKQQLDYYSEQLNDFLRKGDNSTTVEERMKNLFHHFEVDDSECPKVALARLAETLGYKLTDEELDQAMHDCHLDTNLEKDHHLGINIQELVAWLSQKDGCDLGDPTARQSKSRRAGLITDPAEMEAALQEVQEADARLVSASLVCRHGSRGPNKSEIKPFLKLCVDGEPTEAQSMISRTWAPDDLEQLTDMGQQQIAQIASWFGSVYLGTRHPELVGGKPMSQTPREAEHMRAPGDYVCEPLVLSSSIDDLAALGITVDRTPPLKTRPLIKQKSSGRQLGRMLKTDDGAERKVKFRVSIVSRTMESAKSFSKHFESDLIDLAPMDNKHADATFRAYKKDQIYLYHMKKDRGSPIFTAKANDHLAFLKDIKMRCGVFKKKAAEEDLLKDTCYFRHMVEVEEAWVGEGKTKHDEVTKLLTPAEREKVCDLGVWVWNRRFFNSFGGRIGGRFLKEVLDDAMAAPSRHITPTDAANTTTTPTPTPTPRRASKSEKGKARPVGVFICHDYSILVLLSAFGLPCYPTDCKLGFACHVLLETFELPSGKRCMKIFLNGNPYHEGGTNCGAFSTELCDRFTLVGFIVDVAKFICASTFLKNVLDKTHGIKTPSQAKQSGATAEHEAAVKMQSVSRGVKGRKYAHAKKEGAGCVAGMPPPQPPQPTMMVDMPPEMQQQLAQGQGRVLL
jgi:Ca2+-binding EF-hand superfamily protein